MQALRLRTVYEIHLVVVDGGELSHPSVALCPRCEAVLLVLHLVVGCPLAVGKQLVEIGELVGCDVRRYPRPSLVQRDVLHTIVLRREEHWLRRTAHYGVVLEAYRLLALGYVGLSGACVPDAELEVVAAYVVRVDREHGVVHVVQLIVAVVAYAYALSAAERSEHVLVVRRVYLIDIQLAEDRHIILEVGGVHRPVGLLALYLHRELQSLHHVVVATQIERLVVCADVQTRIDSQHDILRRSRVDGAACRFCLKP